MPYIMKHLNSSSVSNEAAESYAPQGNIMNTVVSTKVF